MASEERKILDFWLVNNLWGWSIKGIYRWVRWGWALYPVVWGVEIHNSDPTTYYKYLKWGPICTRVK
jgi:hypothetical protein